MILHSKLNKYSCSAALAIILFGSISAFANNFTLTDRGTPAPVTTNSIPHIQIDVEPVPELSKELLDKVSKIPGVVLRDTIIGRAGSTSFWLKENTTLARPNVIVRGREFGHLHPDGSLHISLPPKLAVSAVKAGWATYHPWANQKAGLEGFVMLYTPKTKAEMNTVFDIIKESYKFVTNKTAL